MTYSNWQMVLLASCFTTNAFAQSDPPQAPFFTNVSELAGIARVAKNYFGNPLWADLNSDNHLDLIIPGHAFTPDIYINNANDTFTLRTAVSTFGRDYLNEWNDFHGYSISDYNNDGVPDIFITVGAAQGQPGFSKRDLLYQGQGDAQFILVSKEAGVENPTGRGRSSCWFDLNLDGHLDFLQKNVVTPSAFYLNSGTGSFSDISEQIGIAPITDGAVCSLVDYNNDGLLDILLAGGGISARLLKQEPDHRFTDVTATALPEDPEPTDAAAWADINNDGYMDLFLTRSTPESYTGPNSARDLHNSLLINNGDGSFSDVTEAAGLAGNFNTPAAAWGDFNNDGFTDLIVANAGEANASGNGNLLYLNNSKGRFTEAGQMAMPGNDDGNPLHRYRGVAVADYNRDGRLDVVFDSGSRPPIYGLAELYRNDFQSNNFFQVTLKGTSVNAPAIGSSVTVSTNATTQIQQHTGVTGGAKFSQSLQPLHFGLGDANALSLRVNWPGDDVADTIIENLAANQHLIVEEGKSIVEGIPETRTETGCYIWHLNSQWNLLCRGLPAQRMSFTGSITSNASISSMNNRKLEDNDTVVLNSQTITFELFAREGLDVISFETEGNTVTFDVYQDGAQLPGHTYIGAARILPGTLPVTLTR